MRKSWFILFFLSASIALQGQQVWTDSIDLDLVIQDIYNVMQEQAESTDEMVDFSLLQSELQARAEHPIYLPTAVREDFASLYFLSSRQIDNILYFLWTHQNNLVSLGQLQLVPGLTDYELRDLMPFCTLQIPDSLAPTTRNTVKHQLLAQVRWTNEEKGNRLGDPLTERIRYRIESGEWAAGIKIEKDAFEPYYYKGRTYGADFYGGYVQWSPTKLVQRVVLGDYLVNYGMGLVVRQTPSFYSSSLDRPADGLKAYTGVDEYRFMRGIGLTMKKGDWDWSAFYSAKRVDGLPEDGLFQVFSKNGYHRTETELNRKQQEWEQQAGLHAEWNHGKWQLGMTVVGDFLQDTLRLRSAYYNQNYFSGNSCITFGISYRYHYNWYTLFGETAVTDKGGVATIDGVHMQLNYKWALQSALRYYGRRFDNPLADAYGEFSRANDERGWLTQVTYSPKRTTKYSLSLDLFDYDYPKYGYQQPGWGWRVSGIVDWSPRSDMLFSTLLRWVNKAQHLQDGAGLLRCRLRWDTETWRIQTQVAATYAHPHAGVSIAGQSKYSFRSVPIYLEGELAYVYAPDYDARMYIYESGGLSFGSSALLYGNGIRTYLSCGYNINRHIRLFGRVIYNQPVSNRLTAELHLAIQ